MMGWEDNDKSEICADGLWKLTSPVIIIIEGKDGGEDSILAAPGDLSLGMKLEGEFYGWNFLSGRAANLTINVEDIENKNVFLKRGKIERLQLPQGEIGSDKWNFELQSSIILNKWSVNAPEIYVLSAVVDDLRTGRSVVEKVISSWNIPGPPAKPYLFGLIAIDNSEDKIIFSVDPRGKPAEGNLDEFSICLVVNSLPDIN